MVASIDTARSAFRPALQELHDSAVSVSTRQAAELLGVHESSVKRWCNAGTLVCWLTPGGHRRIRIAALVAFARAQDVALPLAGFGAYAEHVWAGMEQARDADDFDGLVALVYAWTEVGWSDLPARLIDYLAAEGFALADLFDRLVGPVMHRIGTNYFEGRLTIGDEHRMTQAMRDALIRLPAGTGSGTSNGPAPPVAIVGCARSEVHELGALMVRRLLERAGWRVVYLGLNVPTEEFATQQLKFGAALVCIAMMPPMGRAEAQTMVHLLDRMYDPAQPYRLVFGGPAVAEIGNLDLAGVRLAAVERFGRMQPFAAWVAAEAR